MELKYLVILSIVGITTALVIPTEQNKPEQSSDLESSFSGSPSYVDSSTGLSRDKRGLIFKKLKKHGSDTVYVNRRYQGSTGVVEYRPNREVHHHHHYSYPPPPVVQQQPYPAPSHEYHHYHGASGYEQGYASHGSTYYSGGYSAGGGSSSYYPKPNYGDGGYAHYGGVGGYVPPPQHTRVAAAPLASGHTAVDRGQGAAAVNNIAIIHARAGSSNSNNLAESESRVLPRPLPVDIEDALNMMD